MTFIDEHWRRHAGAEADTRRASERLRPILMTACAPTIGIVPMSWRLESGSQMERR